MSTQQLPRVLVVDDETQMIAIVAFALETQGFEPVTARSAEQAWKLLSGEAFDLLVVDVMLPGASGVDLVRRVRVISDLPIIMLTARSEEEDRLAGLLAGADDYVTKPFSPRELALRAQSLVRRSRGGRSQRRLTNGSLEMDVGERTAKLAGRGVHLSDVEFRLLLVLIQHCGEVVTWREVLNEVWATAEVRGGRDMIKTTVHRLRQRLEPHGESLIVAVRGAGYLMPVLSDET